VRAPRAGFATLLAPLGSDVAKGQTIAVMTDAFGRRTETITAPVAGRISTRFTDPRRERGDMIVRIIHTSDAPECAMGC
jgi:predicted deacylase